ncbi:NAD(P)H-binding protein [Cupriavidus pampae]|uniref:NAD(P)H-binding protein n=1 Tax=Cupriavidus pampae TaxID=659251 RepID=UPI001CC51BDE|nr:NAD(P)H-binding protein [Cupriavidus pampae]
MHKPSLLVSGISGQLGRSVIEQLSGRPGYRLIGTTRTPTSRLDFATHGIDVRYANFDDPSCLAKAFDGADRILLISTSAEYCGPRRVEQHRHAIAAARDAGARQLIYTSLLNADASTLGPIASDHALSLNLEDSQILNITGDVPGERRLSPAHRIPRECCGGFSDLAPRVVATFSPASLMNDGS